MSQSKSCQTEDSIEFNPYSITILEIPGIQGLSGPPGPQGPQGEIGPTGQSADINSLLEVFYNKDQIRLFFSNYKRLFKFWVIPEGIPNGIRTAYTISNDTFIPETLKIYVNGLLESGFDILSNNSFQIHNPPLEDGDIIYCEYLSQQEYDLLMG